MRLDNMINGDKRLVCPLFKLFTYNAFIAFFGLKEDYYGININIMKK